MHVDRCLSENCLNMRLCIRRLQGLVSGGQTCRLSREGGLPMRLRVLVLAAGILCPASGFAEEFQFPTFLSGNKLLEACTPVQLPFCYGYVEGVADALQSTFSALHMQQHALFCLPQGVTSRQLVDIATNYLRDHPEQRHTVASANVALALANAFPCPR